MSRRRTPSEVADLQRLRDAAIAEYNAYLRRRYLVTEGTMFLQSFGEEGLEHRPFIAGWTRKRSEARRFRSHREAARVAAILRVHFPKLVIREVL